jgi:hypothetical protein
MATSVFFNNFNSTAEQNLIEDLIIESIKIYGIDVYYIPRTTINRDAVFREGSTYSYDKAYVIEAYIRNVDGFTGDGEFLSKFGLQVRDQIVFTMAQRTFKAEVGNYTAEVRPDEGDLIWFPLTKTVFQIKNADVKPIFYQLGALQTYDLTCELYEASSETFNTGIAEIDNKYNALSLVSNTYEILLENGNVLVTEAGEHIILESFDIEAIDVQAENDVYEQEGLDFIDFTEFDPFSEKAGGYRT